MGHAKGQMEVDEAIEHARILQMERVTLQEVVDALWDEGVIDKNLNLNEEAYQAAEYDLVQSAIDFGILKLPEIEPANLDNDIPAVTARGKDILALYLMANLSRGEPLPFS
jgi:hypothetical protein